MLGSDFYKIEIFLGKEYINKILEEINKLGACRVGNYDLVSTFYEVEGCFRPLEEANPYEGKIGEVFYGKEYKLEVRCEKIYLKKVVKKIREIHPYEEPLINIIKLEVF